MKEKKRLDLLVQQQYPAYSRQQIQSWIMQGKVTVNGKTIAKPGVLIADDAAIELSVALPKYVSRAGFKLEAALNHFHIPVEGFVALDAGISTGGFTDCLLQQGVRMVYGIDVGYGQVHEKIKNDPRVVVFERTNLRTMQPSDLPERVDMVTLDLSFISVLKVMDAVVQFLKEKGHLIVLIKPQFEARKEDVGRGGIIKDSLVHKRVVQEVIAGIAAYGFTVQGVIDSPLHGTMGNKEFLAYFIKTAP
jgi:23S rRNA (cytidine1920-2'-O)/16S rRNA (cytidine1409-2'-O)-methyltransferase